MPEAARVVVVASGKGGVGTSTVATLLALVTAASGRRTLLVDAADAPGARHLLFGTSGSISGPEPFTGSGGVVSDADGIAPVTPSLSIATPTSAQATTIARSPAELRAAIRGLGSRFSNFRTVIIDGGSSLHSILSACEAGVDRLVLVTNSDRVCLAGAYAVIKAFGQRLGHRPVVIIGNRLDAKSAMESTALLDSATHHFLERTVDFGGSIPDDGCLAAGLAAGMALADAVADSPAAAAAESIADRLIHPARVNAGQPHEERISDARGQIGSASLFPSPIHR